MNFELLGRRVVSAFIATAFAQDDADAAKGQWRRVADQLRPKVPKLEQGALRMKCTRQRCQVALSTFVTAALMPS